MGTTQVIPPGASTLGRIEGAWENLNRTQRWWATVLAVFAGWACWEVGQAMSANEFGAVTATAASAATAVTAATAVAAVAMCAGCAALVDASTQRIPNRLLAVAATAVAAAVLAGVAGELIAPHVDPHGAAQVATPAAARFAGQLAGQITSPATGVLLGMLGAAVPMLVVRLQRGSGVGGLGLGDVKLAAVLGAAGGFVDARVGLATVFLAALAASTFAALTHRRRMALGPWLFVAWLVTLVVVVEVAS